MYLHAQNQGGLLMDNSVIINGFIHQLFTDAECHDILHTYFKLPLYTIAAFAPDTKNNNCSYQHDVISFIPEYASGCSDCFVWFYRTENHELLLIFNHNENFNITQLFFKKIQLPYSVGNKPPMRKFFGIYICKKRGTYMPF